ncbi:MAG: efflux RND transporter periplasmic adaptor subunit [Deltaproteobacteria bacterium]|nr:efflux RND transporter periplasmic adaptor subunit [Deltaproteobacteria bacterium]
MKRFWKAALLIAIALGGGVLAFRALARERGDGTRYRTQGVDRGDLLERVTAVGTLQAVVQVDVGSQVSGRILRLHADFNSPVRRGDLLAELDPAVFSATVGQARAAAAAARAKLAADTATVSAAELALQRAQDLQRGRFGTQAAVDDTRAALTAALAAVEGDRALISQATEALRLADANLAYTRIRAPIDGVVIARNVNVGQTVAASLQSPVLFVLAQDLSRMQVLANVDEADVGRLREGMSASFSVDAFPGEPFRGSITQIRYSPVNVQNVVTYVAVIEVSNPERKLRPGMTATVEIVTRERHGVVRIPNAALRYHPPPDTRSKAKVRRADPGSPPPGPGRVGRVHVLRHGVPELVVVRLGATDGVRTELVAGDVRPGERAVIEAVLAGGAGRRFKIF